MHAEHVCQVRLPARAPSMRTNFATMPFTACLALVFG